MYKVQFINTFTQEILREAGYNNSFEIERMVLAFVKSGEIDQPTLIICNKQKTWKAEYLFHKVVIEGNDTYYKVFFIVSLSDVQAKIIN